MSNIYLGLYLRKILPGIKKFVIYKEYLVLYLYKEYLVTTLLILKNHHNLKINCLMDIWGVDYLGNSERFEVNYLLLSIKYNIRVIIKIFVSDATSLVSINNIYSSSIWLEREVWDLFGIYFFSNNDLRRILTDYGFEGYPLRKDFPLSGFVEVRYDDTAKLVLQEPIEISQMYRVFNFKSPWE